MDTMKQEVLAMRGLLNRKEKKLINAIRALKESLDQAKKDKLLWEHMCKKYGISKESTLIDWLPTGPDMLKSDWKE